MEIESHIQEYNKTRIGAPHKTFCYIPSKHMFFSFNGVVQNCCYSGKQSYLGKWPDQKVREIWFGDAANRLREAMDANDFSLGCTPCLQAFLDGQY
jgi:hypothetical protein